MTMKLKNFKNLKIGLQALGTHDATAAELDITSPKTAYAAGQKKTGSRTKAPHVTNKAYAQDVTCSISCVAGELIVVGIAKREALTTPEGWTLFRTDSGIGGFQWLSVLYKIATSTTETFTTTTGSPTRIYIGMIAIRDASTLTFVSETIPGNNTFNLTRASADLHLWFGHVYIASAVAWTMAIAVGAPYIVGAGLLRAPAENPRLCIAVDFDKSGIAQLTLTAPYTDGIVTGIKVT